MSQGVTLGLLLYARERERAIFFARMIEFRVVETNCEKKNLVCAEFSDLVTKTYSYKFDQSLPNALPVEAEW